MSSPSSMRWPVRIAHAATSTARRFSKPASTVPPPPENRWALAYTGGVSGPATGEKQTNEPQSSRAERAPNAKLALTSGAAREQKAGNVRARAREHAANRSEHHDEHRRGPADDVEFLALILRRQTIPFRR